ncbi:MAG: porin family protein [Bacteroidota bacterium]
MILKIKYTPFLLIALFLILQNSSFSQKVIQQNYRKFDDKLIHFGFLLGGNTADFQLTPVSNAYEKYNVLAIESVKTAGGQLGIVSTLKLGTPLLRLRVLPSLSFQERVIKYYYPPENPEDKKEVYEEERINSTNLDFPIMLQFRTARFNNFATYVLGGAQFTYDLQSTETKNQNFVDPFVKIKAKDWQGQVGVGVEFFAVYFKLGLEVKYSQGFQNTFIQDQTPVSNPIDQLKNKIWSFSIIFEG